MDDRDSSKTKEGIRAIVRVLESAPATALGGSNATEVAQRWVEAGFDDAEEVEAWIAARCFTVEGAQALERAGMTPEQARIKTRDGDGDYEDTIGYKLVRGDLSFDEARRIITREFWDS